MNFKQEKLRILGINTFRALRSPKTWLAAIAKPWHIPSAIAKFFKDFYIIVADVKLNPISLQDQLSIARASQLAIAKLALERRSIQAEPKSIRSIFGEDVSERPDCKELAELFKSYGSDKSTTHDYYLVYASVLTKKKNEAINIFEIGLGTNNIDVLSNMGVYGKPGASLRSFRDMYKHASVIGADVDKRVLFSEERIETHFVDQTDLATFDDLKKVFGETRFDLIIDDGLHNSQANLNTMNFALDLIKPDGVFIIEDIRGYDFPYYQAVAAILKGQFQVDFIQTKRSCICMFRRAGQ